MAKQREEGAAVSLFPFMSILVCLIGGLTLMISILTLTQMGSKQSQDVIDRYHKYTQLKSDAEQDAAELESLRKKLAEAEELQKQIQQALAEAAALEKQQAEEAKRIGADQARELLAESNQLRQRIAELEPEPAKLQATIDALKQQIQQRAATSEEAVVQIRPSGTGAGIKPTFVECTANGAVVHEGPEPMRIRTADLAKEDGEFRKLLDRVAGTPKGQVIFLVRPDAVGTYNTAYGIARSHYGPHGYCRNGKLPVPTQGNIDLELFKN